MSLLTIDQVHHISVDEIHDTYENDKKMKSLKDKYEKNKCFNSSNNRYRNITRK